MKPVLAIVLATLLPAEAGHAATCGEESWPTEPARLSGLDSAGDLLLADGRVVRLIGVAPRQDEAEDARFRAAFQPLIGREVVLSVTGEKDRWARWPVRIRLPAAAGETAGQDIALLLRQSGAAQPMPEGAAAPCGAGPAVGGKPTTDTAQGTPPATQAAKIDGVGIDGAVDGHDLAAVKAREGRYVVLEGRIASVGERPQRTYLNFSRRPKEAAAIVVSRKLWRELQGAGWTAASLGGKRLRAHGVLGGRDGLLLEATSRAALELID